MADFRALETISDVLMRLLQASYEREDFDDQRLRFTVFQGDDFRSNDLNAGVSLFLYRVAANGTHRTPPGRRAPDGTRRRTELPLDLHYLITIWARSAPMQHRIAGWVTRTLEDTPVLPSGLLHGARPDVFGPNETVEIVLNDLTNEDLFRIWDILGEAYRLSIPYLVRNVRIGSEETVPAAEPVDERIFDFLDTRDR